MNNADVRSFNVSRFVQYIVRAHLKTFFFFFFSSRRHVLRKYNIYGAETRQRRSYWWLMEGCGWDELILEQCLRATSFRSLQGEGHCTQRQWSTKLCRRKKYSFSLFSGHFCLQWIKKQIGNTYRMRCDMQQRSLAGIERAMVFASQSPMAGCRNRPTSLHALITITHKLIELIDFLFLFCDSKHSTWSFNSYYTCLPRLWLTKVTTPYSMKHLSVIAAAQRYFSNAERLTSHNKPARLHHTRPPFVKWQFGCGCANLSC